MAKFVEWANSLLGRFEEQVLMNIQLLLRIFSKIFRFSKMSHEKSINLLQVIFIFYFVFLAAISHRKYQHTSKNKYRTEHRAKLNSNIEVSLFFSYCRFDKNASRSQRNCEWE